MKTFGSIVVGSILAGVTAIVAFSYVPKAIAQRPLEKLEDQIEEELPPPAPELSLPALTAPAKPQPPENQPVPAKRANSKRANSKRANSKRGRLGVVADDDPRGRAGALVLLVREDSPAKEGGLQQNDLITAINGRVIRDVEGMGPALQNAAPGEKMSFDIIRASRPMKVEVILGELIGPPPGAIGPDAVAPENMTPENTTPEGSVAPVSRARLGVTVQTLSEDLRVRYRHTQRRGAVITAVHRDGPAHAVGVPVGALIVAVDGVAVDNHRQVIQIIANSKPGQEVTLEYHHEGRLYRQSVNLGAAPVPSPPEIPSPADLSERRGALRFGPFPFRSPMEFHREMAARRPLERLERFLEDMAESTRTPPPTPPHRRGAGEDLPARIDRLNNELERLRRRVVELEDELAAERARK